MQYKNILKARFKSRPNRFIAIIEINDKEEICHVKNTGKCKELLVENATIYVEEIKSEKRKTKFDLIAVLKDERLINIDSQAPNKIIYEWIQQKNFMKNISCLRSEVKYKNSRFDFYLESNKRKILIEVKGVTLEEDGIVKFPDAQTQRGVKHIKELCKSLEDGYEAYIIFVIQMEEVKYFTPNYDMHKEFGEELKLAKENGVNIIALDCKVGGDYIYVNNYIDIML